MQEDQAYPRRLTPVWRVVIEIALLIFFSYSVRLMGEFAVANVRGKSLALALEEICTGTNFLIAIISALIGVFLFEFALSLNRTQAKPR